MRNASPCVLFVSALLTSALLAATLNEEKPAMSPEEENKLVQVATGLYSKDSAVRERARRELIAAGDHCIPVMERVSWYDPKFDYRLFEEEKIKVLSGLRTRAAVLGLVECIGYSRSWTTVPTIAAEETVRRDFPSYAALVEMGQQAVPELGQGLVWHGTRDVLIVKALRNIGGPEATEHVRRYVNSLEGELQHAKLVLQEMEKDQKARQTPGGPASEPRDSTK